MNKYIESDIENGIKQMRIGAMNALYDIDSGETDFIDLDNIPTGLLINCIEKSKWEINLNRPFTNEFIYIFGKSLSGKSISIEHDILGKTIIIAKDNES